MAAGLRTEPGRNLNAKNHPKLAGRRTRSERSRGRCVRLCISIGTEFGNLGGSNLLRRTGAHRRWYALRPRLGTATALILTRRTVGGELARRRCLGLADPRTTGMACGHSVVVSGQVLGNVPRNFSRLMEMAGTHEDHRRQGHLCPDQYDHQQRRGNGFLEHPVPYYGRFTENSCDSGHTQADPILPDSPAPPAARENETCIRWTLVSRAELVGSRATFPPPLAYRKPAAAQTPAPEKSPDVATPTPEPL